MKYSPELLASFVPALRSATEEVGERVAAFFAEAQHTAALSLGFDTSDEMETHVPDRLLLPLVYRICARLAVASLDLVATATGFGVVSSSTYAPASAHRVEALREELRRSVSTLTDTALTALREAGTVPPGRISTLIFAPSLARRFGLTLDGAEVFAEEFATLRPALDTAEREVMRFLSPELYHALVVRLQVVDDDPTYRTITAEAQRTVVALVTRQRHALDPLDALLNRLENQLPEYLNSPTYTARHASPYENKEDDPSFFLS